MIQRTHDPLDVMFVCVRWYALFPLRFRNIEELKAELGVWLDHSTLHRGSIKTLLVLAAASRRRKQSLGKQFADGRNLCGVAGQWECLYGAVDEQGATVDFLWRAKRDPGTPQACFERAIGLHDAPEKIAIDKSCARSAAIVSRQADSRFPIEMRQSKSLNNLVDQDHRAVRRITRPTLGYKCFRRARTLIVGIEVMHMIRTGQLGEITNQASSATSEF